MLAELPELTLILLAAGLLTLLLGVLSAPMRRASLSEPVVALGIGLLLGPYVLGWLDLQRWGEPQRLLGLAAQLTLAVGLVAVGLRIPPRSLRGLLPSIAVLLIAGMVLMWLASSLIVAGLLGTSLLVALVIGAVLTPTDPVVASTIVTGRVAEKNLPARVRHLVSGEAGLNDGLALPFVALPLSLLLPPAAGLAWEAVRLLVWEIAGGALGGLAIGAVGGRLLHWADTHHTIERESFLAYSLALSLIVLGVLELAGMQTLLGAFMAGVGMNLFISGHERLEEENVQDAVNRFFSIPVFLLLGVGLPIGAWLALGPGALLAVVLLLLLRRLPAAVLLGRFVPALAERNDRLFVGWFGPIGVAALFYVGSLPDRGELEQAWPVVSLVIVGSILAHGLTAGVLTRLYGQARAD